MIKGYSFEKDGVVNNKDLSLLIIAGIHGEEIGAVFLAYELISYLNNAIKINDIHNSKDKKGNNFSYYAEINRIDSKSDFWNSFPNIKNITLIPICNMNNIRYKKQYEYNPSDLNRNWDHMSTKTFLSDMISKSNIVIDLHCSPDKIANQVLLDIDQPDLSFICEELKEMNIQYMIRGIKEGTIKRYVNSYPEKLGITWEQIGFNYINRNVNNIAKVQLLTILENIGNLYWKIRKDRNNEKESNKNFKLSRTITASTEGIVVPGPSIINTPIYENPCVIEPQEDIFRIQSFDGTILDNFYAEEYIYLSQLRSFQWTNIDEPVAIIQPI